MVDSATRSKIIKSLKIALWCVLGAILLFVVIVVGTLLVDKYVKKSPVPMFAGYGSMIVISSSMSGTIEKGDLVIVKRMDEYKQGDIVTYILPNGIANTHRIVRYADESRTTFITKGDAVDDEDQLIDPVVTMDDIKGKVVLTIPHVGLFFNWVTDDGGWIYIFALIVVVVAGVFFLNMTKSDEEKAEATAEATSDDPTSPLNDSTDSSATSPKDAVQPDEESTKN